MSDELDFDIGAGAGELALAGVKKLNENMRKLHARLKDLERDKEMNEKVNQQVKNEVDELQKTMIEINTLLDVTAKQTDVNLHQEFRSEGDQTNKIATEGGSISE